MEGIGISFGSEHEVDICADVASNHLILSAQRCAVVVLHNHPSTQTLSVEDIRFFLPDEAELKKAFQKTRSWQSGWSASSMREKIQDKGSFETGCKNGLNWMQILQKNTLEYMKMYLT